MDPAFRAQLLGEQSRSQPAAGAASVESQQTQVGMLRWHWCESLGICLFDWFWRAVLALFGVLSRVFECSDMLGRKKPGSSRTSLSAGG